MKTLIGGRLLTTAVFCGELAPHLAKTLQQRSQSRETLRQGIDQAADEALKEGKSFGKAQFPVVQEAKRSDQPVKEDQTKQAGVELTQDAIRTPGAKARQFGLGFPQFENEFDLPAQRIYQRHLFGRQTVGRDIGNKETEFEQSEMTGRWGSAMLLGLSYGFAPSGCYLRWG